jgi:hypothetical protein
MIEGHGSTGGYTEVKRRVVAQLPQRDPEVFTVAEMSQVSSSSLLTGPRDKHNATLLRRSSTDRPTFFHMLVKKY